MADNLTVVEPATAAADARQPLRRCSECGTLTDRRWCSTRCHRADEPGAYEAD